MEIRASPSEAGTHHFLLLDRWDVDPQPAQVVTFTQELRGGSDLFGAIKNHWKKAEAAVVIQNLLEVQARGAVFDGDPASIANKLVGKAWDAHPQLFDGRFGQRPHKVSIAATSLAMAVDALPENSRLKPHLMISLGQLLQGIAANEFLLPLTHLDQHLLSKAAESFSDEADAFASTALGMEIDGILRRAAAE